MGEPDARRIVERASGMDGAEWVLGLDDPVPSRVLPFTAEMVERREAGEPLQYVVGRWGFRSLDLFVDRRVLIPRPETETVVEVALDAVGRDRPGLRCLDLGTGSGAIALSLATELPRSEVWAVDESADALAVARANTAAVGGFAATRVTMLEGSWYESLPPGLRGSFDLVVSNPPYVADDEDLPPVVGEWEPRGALRSGPTGLEDVELVLRGAPDWLRPGGVVVVEMAPHQTAAAADVALAAGLCAVEVAPDAVGRDRAVVARRPG